MHMFRFTSSILYKYYLFRNSKKKIYFWIRTINFLWKTEIQTNKKNKKKWRFHFTFILHIVYFVFVLEWKFTIHSFEGSSQCSNSFRMIINNFSGDIGDIDEIMSEQRDKVEAELFRFEWRLLRLKNDQIMMKLKTVFFFFRHRGVMNPCTYFAIFISQ